MKSLAELRSIRRSMRPWTPKPPGIGRYGFIEKHQQELLTSDAHPSEALAIRELIDEGWTVLRGGAPDLVAFKENDGQITKVKGVEVKEGKGSLSPRQLVYKRILESLGAEYECKHI